MKSKADLDKVSEELNIAVTNMRTLTALFYARMSGQIAWKDGEKAECMERFKDLDAIIDDLRGQQNAEWFGSLAPGSEGPRKESYPAMG